MGDGYYAGVTTYEYEEGTLIVHLAESSKKELVWRATIVEMLRDSPEKNVELTHEVLLGHLKTIPPVMKK